MLKQPTQRIELLATSSPRRRTFVYLLLVCWTLQMGIESSKAPELFVTEDTLEPRPIPTSLSRSENSLRY